MNKHDLSQTVFAPVSSEITLSDGERVFAVDRAFLSVLSTNADPILDPYRIGWDVGRAAYHQLESRVMSGNPEMQGMRDLAMPDFVLIFSNHLASMGWGRFDLKKRDEFLFIDVQSSPLADTPASSGKGTTKCSFLAGFFASIFSAVSDMDLACIEVTCHADGYEWCSFLLDNKSLIERVHEFIKSNYAPLEAFQKMKSTMGVPS